MVKRVMKKIGAALFWFYNKLLDLPIWTFKAILAVVGVLVAGAGVLSAMKPKALKRTKKPPKHAENKAEELANQIAEDNHAEVAAALSSSTPEELLAEASKRRKRRRSKK